MSLQYLETNLIGSYLIDAWQNQLDTEKDPTSGKWFRQGPDNSVGLFGGLTDILVTDLAFDAGAANVNKSRDVALSTTLDNRSGLLNESPATNTLQWQITNSATTSHSKTNSVKSTVSEKIVVEVSTELFAKFTSETTLSFEYAYSWTDTNAVTQSETKSFTTQVPLKVPAGKAYKLLILADKASLSVPYHAQIRLKGTSEANFNDKVNGKAQWSASAGDICSWINKYGSAKGDAMEFGADPDNPADGIASIRGSLRADQSVNFTVFAIDVTSTLDADPSSSAAISKLLKGEKLPDNQIVSSSPVSAG
jgi:hypothetical protein